MIARILLALVLAGVLSLPALPVSAIDLDTYRARIEAANDVLSGANPDVAVALSELRGVEPVELENGTVVNPDLSLVIAALETSPPDEATARAGLTAILSALDAGTNGGINDAEAHAALADVLAREEFQPAPEEEQSRSLWQRFLSWIDSVLTPIFEWIDRLFGGSGDGNSPASIVMAIVGVLVIIGIVAFAVRSVRESMTPGVTRLANGAAEEHYTSAEARAEAERLFAAGEYRAALRLLYLATLIRWEEAGRLRFDRSLTNREVVARVTLQGDAPLLGQLSPLVDRFDRVWYGGATCTAEDYTNFASLADRAWEAA